VICDDGHKLIARFDNGFLELPKGFISTSSYVVSCWRIVAALAEFYRDVLGLRVVPTDAAALSAPPAADRAEARRW
jgi:hypothetical protein